MMPTLAVVGQPNKGKSSIVATMAENTQVAISPVPGTTRAADHFTLKVNGEALYDLIDTPGFQRAGQVHQWLQTHESDASSRADVVRQFVEQHGADNKFADECALLQPIIDGAGILYVVDGSKPYGPEYELEMDILRWTGQPRMALINMIGSGDYRDAWRAGLGQYFSIVREFNAHQASFSQRIALLRAFAEIEENWRVPLYRSADVLEAERKRQLRRASDTVADLLQTATAARIDKPVSQESPTAEEESQLQHELTQRLHNTIRQAEARAQQQIQQIYRHDRSHFSTQALELLDTDLFTERSWQLFGLSKTQLLATGAVSGAVAGGTVDLLVGGSSLLLGSVVGSALGSLTAWFGAPELAKLKVLGVPLGGATASVGPIKDTNFPWVLLGRACLHHTLISERNHAVRETLLASFEQSEHFFDFLSTSERNDLERGFTQLRKDPGSKEQLSKTIAHTLNRHKQHRTT